MFEYFAALYLFLLPSMQIRITFRLKMFKLYLVWRLLILALFVSV